MNKFNHQLTPQSIKIPFGEFPRIKCKCGGDFFLLTRRFRCWRVPRLLQHEFANQHHVFAELYSCAECGQILEDVINIPKFPSGKTTEDLAPVYCTAPNCNGREFVALHIAHIVPATYCRIIGANRLNIEYMLCAKCGAPAKEINLYPLPEGAQWKSKK